MSVTTYRLKRPVEYGSQSIEELSFREMELGDMENWNLGSLGSLSMKNIIELLAALSGQPPSVIRRMKMEDTAGVFEIIKKSMPAGL